MLAVFDRKRTRSPDLIGALAGARARPAELTPPELVDAIGAILDRADVAGADERARLARVRGKLEAELADRLAE